MSSSIKPDSDHFLLDLPFFFGVEPDIGLFRLDPLFSPKVKQDFRPFRLDLFCFVYCHRASTAIFCRRASAAAGSSKTPGEPR